jgi:hypothetical protein
MSIVLYLLAYQGPQYRLKKNNGAHSRCGPASPQALPFFPELHQCHHLLTFCPHGTELCHDPIFGPGALQRCFSCPGWPACLMCNHKTCHVNRTLTSVASHWGFQAPRRGTATSVSGTSCTPILCRPAPLSRGKQRVLSASNRDPLPSSSLTFLAPPPPRAEMCLHFTATPTYRFLKQWSVKRCTAFFDRE